MELGGAGQQSWADVRFGLWIRKVGEVLRPKWREGRAGTGGYALLLWMGCR